MIAQEEAWPDVVEELKGLIHGHWEELALNKDKVPLDPDWQIYDMLHQFGRLLFVSLRDEGKLVGYYIGVVAPQLHYKGCLAGTMDIYYVHPDVRGRFGGLRLMRATERALRARGVQRWVCNSKDHRDSSRLFRALGFTQIETVHGKWLGD